MNEEYKAKLDNDILDLLRVRAMQENIVPTPGSRVGCHEELVEYLHSLPENEKYFTELSRAIGYEDNGQGMKRSSVKVQNVWELVRHQMANVVGMRFENVAYVEDATGCKLDRDSARYFMAEIFGFQRYKEMYDAVLRKGFKLPDSDRMVTIEEQDFIARTLGYKGWADICHKEDASPKVSVTMLKRIFGKAKSGSALKMQKLDYIAFFIAEMTWNELQQNKDDVWMDIDRAFTPIGSAMHFIGRPRKEYPHVVHTSRLIFGDKVTLVYPQDKKMTMKFVGDYTFEILKTQSKHLKPGYNLTAYEIRVNEHLHSNDVFDENGEVLDMMYDSDTITRIHFEGVAVNEKPWTGLNGRKSGINGKMRTFAPMKEKVMNKIEGAMSKASCKKLCVMGSGSMCFDTIIQREYPQGFVKGKKNKFVDRVVMEEIGSNPGNVMCILGYFGWESYPIAMFDEYPQGLQMKKDFERYHCNTRYVTNTKEGGTNCFSVIHCLDDQTGEPTMKHSKKHAPFSGFPREKGLTVMGKDATLPKFIDGLNGFLPDVYFYSGDNAGWRELGKYMHSKGVLVYYEVQSMNMKDLPKYIKCMKESDIVKFSDETISHLGFVDELRDKLIIQTLGEKGVRFNLCGQGWVELAPVHNDNVVDTEGCGDWTTASFINAIGKRGVLKLSDMNKEIVKECLAEAQEYASRNVSYMGTKGMIADDKDFNLAPSDYVDTIMAEMDGHIGVKKGKISNLKDIPAKDLKIYDAKDCLVYRSDYECLNGVERKLEKGECSVMSNFYPCKLPYIYNGKDLVFNSAEQAYHFFRYREFPKIQWMIMQQKDAKSVMKACQGFKYVDSDHEKTRWMYMTLIEELKYLYCKEFRKKINNLSEILLVESSGDDDIFGSTIPGTAQKALAYAKKKGIDLTGKYIGMNGCGRCIMAVREKFRGWTDKQLNEYIPAPDINVWWESSPAYNELIEGMGKY